jgi:hypothetical protein
MGFVDFKSEPEHLEYLRKRLASYGLKPDKNWEWEIHGPHQDMDYQVYIGYAKDARGIEHCVAVYPRSIYEVDDPSDWYKGFSENRLSRIH